MRSISRLEAETLHEQDLAAEALLQFWELPTNKQKRNLSGKLAGVLRHYGIDEEDFSQEIAIALWQDEKTVLCQQRTGRVIRTSTALFKIYQRWTFRNLIKPFRTKKRGERVIPYSDPRWQHPTDRAPFLLQDPLGSSMSISDLTDSAACAHNPEIVLSLRFDLPRLFDQLREFPEPLVLAALGWISTNEGIAKTGMRRQKAQRLLRRVRQKARSFLCAYGRSGYRASGRRGNLFVGKPAYL